jgi:hypothetical protein
VTSTAPFYQRGDRYRATVRSLAGPLALLLVALAPVVVVGAVSSAGRWGRWLVRTGGAVGIVGLVLTAVATVNLVVPRTCASAPVRAVNRPVLSLAVDDGDCFHSALGQVGLAGLVGVAASVGAAAVAQRRATPSAPAGAGAAPAVPSR